MSSTKESAKQRVIKLSMIKKAESNDPTKNIDIPVHRNSFGKNKSPISFTKNKS